MQGVQYEDGERFGTPTEMVAEIKRLRSLIKQVHGLADEGVTAPNAAYRWCERIDEAIRAGEPLVDLVVRKVEGE